MKKRDAFELYVDYLLSSPGKATATGLSEVLDKGMTHDYISDFLSQKELDAKAFWKEVKPFARQVEDGENAWVSIDDTIIEKPHSSESELVCWHWDHTKGENVKGLNMLNFLLNSPCPEGVLSCPLGFELVRKTVVYEDKKGVLKRKSPVTKNEKVLERLGDFVFRNKVAFKYVLFDSWFSSADTLKFVHKKIKKVFVCPLKANRLVALSEKDKNEGRFIKIKESRAESGEVLEVWPKGLGFPVMLSRQVFENKDRSTGELWLATNDLSMDGDRIRATYQKRWGVEQMHKSLKQNMLLGKSQSQLEASQHNHVFSALMAFVKLEKLKIKEKLNHFALKAKLHLKMTRAAMVELQNMQDAYGL